MPPPDLAELLDPHWVTRLTATRRSPATISSYVTGVRSWIKWATENDHPEITRRGAEAWVSELMANGAKPATARARLAALKQFTAWLTTEEEIKTDPLLGMKPPKLDEPVVQPLSDDELRALLETCKTRSLVNRRDEAILRLMLETGMRAGEVADLRVQDVDLSRRIATVVKGKGGKTRVVPFSAHVGEAISRYLRQERARHSKAETSALWLGDRGKSFSYAALWLSLGQRATKAGISDFHPHRLRHTAAHRWLAAGGSEGGLMSVAGWSRPDMLLRYTKARAAERAAEEADRLDLGDL